MKYAYTSPKLDNKVKPEPWLPRELEIQDNMKLFPVPVLHVLALSVVSKKTLIKLMSGCGKN